MPYNRIPISTENPVEKIVATIDEIEATGGQITFVNAVGDAYLIIYRDKPRVGRPPKTETRG